MDLVKPIAKIYSIGFQKKFTLYFLEFYSIFYEVLKFNQISAI
jgi:hypothetical protein